MSGYAVEVDEPGQGRRRVTIESVLEVGREVDGLSVDDERVSRRHVRFDVDQGRLVVTDLGSTNGTTVNDTPINGPTEVRVGDVVVVGSVRLAVVADGRGGDGGVTRPVGSGATPAPGPAAHPRPVLDELEARESDAAVVRYRPGTEGAQRAPAVLRAARAARRRLAGFGSEPWGVRPTICLVDPFPDPADPTRAVTSGTIVDGARNEIWMVVTAESPPEPLERSMALVFGASLPAAESSGLLVEGYGLHLAGAPDVDAQLRQIDLPPLDAAEGELRAAMAVSFVGYLIDRDGRDAFVRMLSTAQPGRLDAAAQQEYGAGLTALEESWRQKLAAGEPDMKTGQFIRLALRYLRPHRRRELEMFVYMLFGLAFTVVFPFAFRTLIDTAIPSGQFSEVVQILAFLTIAVVISSLAGLRQAYLSAVVSGSVVRQVRQEMFSKLQYNSQGWYAQNQQGDVLSRLLSDVAVLEQGLSETLRGGAVQLLSLVVSATVLVILNPLLAAIVLAGAPIIAVIYKSMAKGALKRSMAVQEQMGGVVSVASENYGAQAVVKAFGLQLREIGRFKQAGDRLFAREVKLQLFGGLFGLSINMVVTVLRVLVLGIGAWLILNDHLTVGGLVAFVSLMGETLSPVTVLTGIGQEIQSSTGALVRINEVLDAPPEVEEADDAPALAPLARSIELRDVTFSYTSERTTLDGVNVTITAGQRVAFVGPTGAGKSSILQMIMRFYDPDEGALLFDGVDIRDASLASLRQQLGVVFQDTFLFNSTIHENIALGNPAATDEQIEAAARDAELHDFVMTLPRGYETLVGERGGRLSGGQRQRLAIARALLRDPRVLLLDEATSALDPRTERMIADTLERVGQGRTTIAVTHRLTSITQYDQIFVVVEGKLVEHGRHDELVAADGVYAQLWAEQTGAVAPVAVAVDDVAALARIPLFASLDRDGLADVAARLRGTELHAGETLAEGGGRLTIVRRGKGMVLAPDFSGELAPVTEVGAGDAFGLSALLGEERGFVLRAVDTLYLGVLDDEAVRGLAGAHPSVADALAGRRAPDAVPVGGQRLSRLTMAPGERLSSVPDIAPRLSQEIRRLTGSLPAVPR